MDRSRNHELSAVRQSVVAKRDLGGMRRLALDYAGAVFVFTNFARLMDFNYYSQIERIAPRPVLFIVGTEAATVFMSKAGYEKAAQPKESFEIPGATHHRLYDDEVAVGKAVAKLEEFFRHRL